MGDQGDPDEGRGQEDRGEQTAQEPDAEVLAPEGAVERVEDREGPEEDDRSVSRGPVFELTHGGVLPVRDDGQKGEGSTHDCEGPAGLDDPRGNVSENLREPRVGRVFVMVAVGS